MLSEDELICAERSNPVAPYDVEDASPLGCGRNVECKEELADTCRTIPDRSLFCVHGWASYSRCNPIPEGSLFVE